MINLKSIFLKYKENKRQRQLAGLVLEAKSYIALNYKPAAKKPGSEEYMIFYQEDFSSMPSNDVLENMAPSFSQILFKFIKQQGISEVECYKKANLDRRLFSKIRSDKNYQPSKATVFALIISLKLNLEQAKELLDSAGYSLSRSIKEDVIIAFSIQKQVYDINMVNEILYSFDCQTLGSQA